MNTYIVMDIENNVSEQAKKLGRKAGHFKHDDIVAIGYQDTYKQSVQIQYKTGFDNLIIAKDTNTLVLHNAKHDLLFLWNKPYLQEFLHRHGEVFDTMLAEYFLTAQTHKYPGLRDIAVNKYGCQERQKYMEEYWDRGIQTSDIPKDVVVKDLEYDVLDTKTIYLEQKKLLTTKQANLLKVQNDLLLATIEMEYNGMYINKDLLASNQLMLEAELSPLLDELEQIIQKLWDYKDPFNHKSGDHLSLLLFGGVIKEESKAPIVDIQGNCVLYKSGPNINQIRFKKSIKETIIQGLITDESLKIPVKKQGFYKVDELVLQKILDHYLPTNNFPWELNKEQIACKIINLILEIRGIEKQISTYYIGTEEQIEGDSCVRPLYQHVKTDTGRLSCIAPNLQNQG